MEEEGDKIVLTWAEQVKCATARSSTWEAARSDPQGPRSIVAGSVGLGQREKRHTERGGERERDTLASLGNIEDGSECVGE